MANIGVQVTVDPSGAVSGGRVATTSLDKIEKSADKATKSTGKLNNVMGAAGYQIADFASQVQYGGNVLGALGVQGGQLLAVLNPMAGAFVTVAGIVGGTYLMSTNEAADSTEALEKAVEGLGTTISIGADGVATFSAQIERLSATNERAARAQIALAVNQTVDALNAANDTVSESITSLDGWTSNLANAATQLDSLDEVMARTGMTTEQVLNVNEQYASSTIILSGYVAQLADEFGITTDQAVSMTRALTAFEQDKSPESLQSLADAVNSVNEATNFTNRELVEFAQVINEGNLTAAQYSQVMSLLKSSLTDLDTVVTANTDSFNKQQSTVSNLSQNLIVLQTRISGNNREAAIQEAVFRSGAEAGSDYAKQIALLSGQQYDLQQQLSATNDAVSEFDQDGAYLAKLEQQVGLINETAREQAMLRAEYSLSEQATATQIEQARQLAGALYDQTEAKRQQVQTERDARREEEQATQFSMGIVGDATGLEALEQKRQIVLQYQEQELGDAQAHAAALVSLERQALTERASITSSGLGSILALQQAYGDDSSGIYRTLLTIQKTATLYSVLLSSQSAIAAAWASAPFPYNLGAVATATVETGALAATVQALTPSFATGGYVQGAGTGTSDSINARLSMGEFVMPARETKRYAPELNDMRSGNYRGGNSTPNIQIVNQTTGKIDSASTSWVDEDTVRVLIREEVPGIVSAEFNDEYSNTNKSIQSQYTMQRKF